MVDSKSLDMIIRTIFKNRDDQIRIAEKSEKIRIKQEARLNPEVRKCKKKKLASLPTLEDEYIKSCRGLLSFLTGNCSESHEELINWSKFKHEYGVYESIDRALIHILFALEDFDGVHQAISRSKIPIDLEIETEDLWDNASYRIHMKSPSLNKRLRHFRRRTYSPSVELSIADLDLAYSDPKNLTAVNRYRIRKRRPCPTIHRYEGGKKYKISRKASQLMTEAFQMEAKPSRSSKEDIARQTGLKMETVSNWFKNRRQRAKARLSCSTMSSSQVSNSPNLAESSQTTLTQTEVSSSQDINTLKFDEIEITTNYKPQYNHYTGDTFSSSQGSSVAYSTQYYPPSIVVQRSSSQDHHQYEQNQIIHSPPDMDYEYNFQSQISPSASYYSAEQQYTAACDYVDQYFGDQSQSQSQQQHQNSYYHYQQDIPAGGGYL